MLWAVLVAALVAAPPADKPPAKESELAAAARREAERRQSSPRSPHTYVDSDLRPPGEPGKEPKAGDAPAVSYAPPPPPPAPRRDPGDVPKEFRGPDGRDIRDVGSADAPAEDPNQGGPDQDAWVASGERARAALAAAQQELAANLGRQDTLRARLNPMNSTYAIDTNEQLQIQSDLTDLQKEAIPLQQAVDEAQAAMTKLQERARREGVPQRWLESDRQ